MAKYIVQSLVMIETVVEVDDDDDVFNVAGDLAGDMINDSLQNINFEFCDEYTVYDENGNEVEEG